MRKRTKQLYVGSSANFVHTLTTSLAGDGKVATFSDIVSGCTGNTRDMREITKRARHDGYAVGQVNCRVPRHDGVKITEPTPTMDEFLDHIGLKRPDPVA